MLLAPAVRPHGEQRADGPAHQRERRYQNNRRRVRRRGHSGGGGVVGRRTLNHHVVGDEERLDVDDAWHGQELVLVQVRVLGVERHDGVELRRRLAIFGAEGGGELEAAALGGSARLVRRPHHVRPHDLHHLHLARAAAEVLDEGVAHVSLQHRGVQALLLVGELHLDDPRRHLVGGDVEGGGEVGEEVGVVHHRRRAHAGARGGRDVREETPAGDAGVLVEVEERKEQQLLRQLELAHAPREGGDPVIAGVDPPGTPRAPVELVLARDHRGVAFAKLAHILALPQHRLHETTDFIAENACVHLHLRWKLHCRRELPVVLELVVGRGVERVRHPRCQRRELAGDVAADDAGGRHVVRRRRPLRTPPADLEELVGGLEVGAVQPPVYLKPERAIELIALDGLLRGLEGVGLPRHVHQVHHLLGARRDAVDDAEAVVLLHDVDRDHVLQVDPEQRRLGALAGVRWACVEIVGVAEHHQRHQPRLDRRRVHLGGVGG
mmetsp:Transcript_2360/g.4725  ORF Transcript_2360/g.4725 Transcript_2360/m.4725 type:complete len:494 (+) Transcript_2360:505-1986(+)